MLKRFASISDPSQMILVIIVDEGPVRIEMTGDPDKPTRVVRSGRAHLMFLPVLNFEDGYGFTYGARFAWPEPFGKRSRIAFPLTWGGDKRAAAELDKVLERGPLTRVTAGGGISQRTNPFYDVDDTRVRVWVRGEREFGRWVRAGATAAGSACRSTLRRATRSSSRTAAPMSSSTRASIRSCRATPSTRARPTSTSPARTAPSSRHAATSGCSARPCSPCASQGMNADRALPPYLKPLLGGMTNLRGFEAGTDAGDTLVAASGELIVPLTSPLGIGKIGVSAFVDTGTV